MKKNACCSLSALLVLAGSITVLAHPQKLSGTDRDRAHEMLKDISSDIRKHYYDPKFNGVDLDARIYEAEQQIDQSPNLNMALSQIAAALDSLNDSHLFFLPPQRPIIVLSCLLTYS